MHNKITILTPCYNRAVELKELYESICSQENTDRVHWLIIDDGSSDDTRRVVLSFENDKKISIEYHKKKNGGKVSAHRFGFKFLETDWYFAIDSDDQLSPDGLRHILNEIDKIEMTKVDSILFHRNYLNSNKIIGDQFKFKYGTYHEFSSKFIKGDKVHIQRSSIAKKALILLDVNENYASMMQFFNRLGFKKIKCIDVGVVDCEYLEGGLTANIIINRYRSPCNTLFMYDLVRLDKSYSFLFRLKAGVNFYRFSTPWYFNFSLKHLLPMLIGRIYFLLDLFQCKELLSYTLSDRKKLNGLDSCDFK
jgi:O18-antigen biosynthesis glycosyltransferase